MNSFKERVSMKDETTIPEKLLSHKAGYTNTPASLSRLHTYKCYEVALSRNLD
jgi:hypothetical protein